MLVKLLRQAYSVLTTPKTKLALIVRADIKMSKGKTAAQCSHASVLCYQSSQAMVKKQQLLDAWCFAGQPKIVLRVANYEEIVRLQEEAKRLGVVAEVVHDAGRTQLDPGTATVLGVGPDVVEHIDKLVAHLKLL